MKTKYILLGIFLAAAGFAAAWFLKPATAPKEASISTAVTASEVWTCSMHPQIRSNEPGQCPICGMDLIPATAASSGDPTVLEMTEAAARLANIRTTVVGSGKKGTPGSVVLNGKLQPDERRSSSLTAHIPGRIEKLYVGFTGEYVTRGQHIAKIYSPELITAQRELIEAKKIMDISPALLEAVKNKLKYWKLPDRTIDEILERETIRETFDIYAESSGIVTNKRVQVGDHVMDGSVLFDVQGLDMLWVVFEAYESDLPAISVGDGIEFTTPALPGQTFRTTVNFIDPVIDPATRIARVRGNITNSAGKLKPEMFVTGTVSGSAAESDVLLVVPKSSVLWTGERSVVYVKVPDREIPAFQYREIRLGESTSEGYRVIDGISPGEEVVVNGAFVIDASAQLNNQLSMMNRDIALKQAGDALGVPDYTASTPDDFKSQLQQVTSGYMALKDALVASNTEEAAIAAADLVEALEEVDMELLDGPAHLFWMKQENSIRAHASAISDGRTLAEQRSQFDHLSGAMIRTVRSFGALQDTLYVQHCPMAIGDKGADWMSYNDLVLNPYFGEKMLSCGFNTDTIVSTLKENTVTP